MALSTSRLIVSATAVLLLGLASEQAPLRRLMLLVRRIPNSAK